MAKVFAGCAAGYHEKCPHFYAKSDGRVTCACSCHSPKESPDAE